MSKQECFGLAIDKKIKKEVTCCTGQVNGSVLNDCTEYLIIPLSISYGS